jgi:hypothetical protein
MTRGQILSPLLGYTVYRIVDYGTGLSVVLYFSLYSPRMWRHFIELGCKDDINRRAPMTRGQILNPLLGYTV